MTISNVVIIGGSAGSLNVILKTVAQFPADRNAVFIIVVHRKNEPNPLFQQLIAARTTMPVREVEDKEQIIPNTIFLAPPNYHLLVEDAETFSLDSSEKVHYSRPSIDVAFESVADIFGNAVIGILLSGANADGAAGLQQIRQHGGFTIVQSPGTAEVDYMPKQAISAGAIDAIVDAPELPVYLAKRLMAGNK